MQNTIERKANSGDMRILLKLKHMAGWLISQDTYDVKVPVLAVSPLFAKRIRTELNTCLKFYDSDYHLWSQRKTGKPLS